MIHWHCFHPDGTILIRTHGKFYAEALCYFTHPSLKVEAPRASDGVRAG
jgi:hypothetical protein